MEGKGNKRIVKSIEVSTITYSEEWSASAETIEKAGKENEK